MANWKDTLLFIIICVAFDAMLLAGITLAPTATTYVMAAIVAGCVAYVLYHLVPYAVRRLARRVRRNRRKTRQRRFARSGAR